MIEATCLSFKQYAVFANVAAVIYIYITQTGSHRVQGNSKIHKLLIIFLHFASQFLSIIIYHFFNDDILKSDLMVS